MRLTLLVLLLTVSGANADTQIHRCPLDDGTFAFQETPCAEPVKDIEKVVDEDSDDAEAPAIDNDMDDLVNPFDEPAGAPAPVGPPLPERLSEDRAACEKETRDAIDAIDLEMRETYYSEEQGKQYLADLLNLTRQLRACKRL